ncbi:hypothetical protein SPMU_02550 [Sphingomonas mucosissima]|uniref:Uncharacterized protein n=1 Tax=Sphingomonas mucosissima TaxID=370959 RepID=A0A245ZQA5_9SPHN|nr:hypothetical protein SPMU_02550 [Sphingomonas mucosissima]
MLLMRTGEPASWLTQPGSGKSLGNKALPSLLLQIKPI